MNILTLFFKPLDEPHSDLYKSFRERNRNDEEFLDREIKGIEWKQSWLTKRQAKYEAKR